MIRLSRLVVVSAPVLAGLAAYACSDAAAPQDTADVQFSPQVVELETGRDTVVLIRNVGNAAVGPVTLVAGGVEDEAGSVIPGPRLVTAPTEIATLNPGDERSVTLTLDTAGAIQDGRYRVELAARASERVLSTLALGFLVSAPPPPAPVVTLTITGPTAVRQGDVVQYTADARDGDGQPVPGTPQWMLLPAGTGIAATGGRVVTYEPGPRSVVAMLGGAADTLDITVAARSLSGSFAAVGQGLERDRFSSDLWVHGSNAYTGTWGGRTVMGTTRFGNVLFAWDIATPASPALTDSVTVDARVVNDVKVRADGQLAVITHEASADGLNGVTLLDLTDPDHPSVITRFTASLETGVHNAWVEGNYVYLVVDGVSASSGLRVLDISNPAAPDAVASFYAGTSFLHDVYVRDGLAFLAHWDAGLVILDVGNGMAGGSPSNPVEVSRVVIQGGQTHNAWYWPAAGYVFVGEEDFATPGMMHVVDVSNLSEPVEVASFRTPGDTPHNFWLDEAAGVLYLAWYGNGVRALDVSGELLGALDRQGREIAGSPLPLGDDCPSATGTANCIWAPQLHNGNVYLSDMNTGLRVMRLDP